MMAQHREALAQASVERQELAAKQSAQVFELLEQNTNLTRMTQELTHRIKELTAEIHQKVGCDSRY
jgi:seryl-tRNA synthetase